MNKNLTEVVVVLDRSGSMSSTKTDAEGGLNTLIEEQKKGVGDVNFTLIQFDDVYEVVYDGVPIKDVKPFTLVPRGWTALHDAIGKAVNTTGERLAKMKEEDRPGLVYLMIITDGGENSSKEFTKSKIKEMLERQQNEYSWKVDFLGSNQDGFAEGTSMGINSSFTYSGDKTEDVFLAGNNKLSRMRSMLSAGEFVVNKYTADEIKSFS